MRLIDADALIKHLQKDPLFELVEQYGITGVIEAQPTIDAIPVNWIIEWSAEHMTEFGTHTIERMLEDWKISVEQSSKDAVKKTN